MWALMSRCDRCADAPFVSNRPRRRPSSPERASLRRFEESASPQINRRGSRARVTPVVRARVDARTTRSRKRAAVCSSEGLAHEASIPEMLCGSPRSLPRAREWHAILRHSECLRGVGVPSDVRGAVAPRLTVYARISINSIIHCRPAPTNSNFPFDLRSRQVAEPNRTRGRKKKLHERNEKSLLRSRRRCTYRCRNC